MSNSGRSGEYSGSEVYNNNSYHTSNEYNQENDQYGEGSSRKSKYYDYGYNENYYEYNNENDYSFRSKETEENETKEDETEEDETKEDGTEEDETKENETRENETKENETKENETKEDETKENETKDSQNQSKQYSVENSAADVGYYYYSDGHQRNSLSYDISGNEHDSKSRQEIDDNVDSNIDTKDSNQQDQHERNGTTNTSKENSNNDEANSVGSEIFVNKDSSLDIDQAENSQINSRDQYGYSANNDSKDIDLFSEFSFFENDNKQAGSDALKNDANAAVDKNTHDNSNNSIPNNSRIADDGSEDIVLRSTKPQSTDEGINDAKQETNIDSNSNKSHGDQHDKSKNSSNFSDHEVVDSYHSKKNYDQYGEEEPNNAYGSAYQSYYTDVPYYYYSETSREGYEGSDDKADHSRISTQKNKEDVLIRRDSKNENNSYVSKVNDSSFPETGSMQHQDNESGENAGNERSYNANETILPTDKNSDDKKDKSKQLTDETNELEKSISKLQSFSRSISELNEVDSDQLNDNENGNIAMQIEDIVKSPGGRRLSSGNTELDEFVNTENNFLKDLPSFSDSNSGIKDQQNISESKDGANIDKENEDLKNRQSDNSNNNVSFIESANNSGVKSNHGSNNESGLVEKNSATKSFDNKKSGVLTPKDYGYEYRYEYEYEYDYGDKYYSYGQYSRSDIYGREYYLDHVESGVENSKGSLEKGMSSQNIDDSGINSQKKDRSEITDPQYSNVESVSSDSRFGDKSPIMRSKVINRKVKDYSSPEIALVQDDVSVNCVRDSKKEDEIRDILKNKPNIKQFPKFSFISQDQTEQREDFEIQIEPLPEFDNSDTEKQYLKDQFALLSKKHKALMKIREDMIKDVRELEKQKLDFEVQKAFSENQLLKATSVKNENAKVVEEIGRKKKELERQQKSLDEKNLKYKDFQKSYDSKIKEFEEREKKLQKMEKMKEEYEKLSKECMKKIKEAENSKAEYEKNNSSVKKLKSELQSQISLYETNNKEVNDKLKDLLVREKQIKEQNTLHENYQNTIAELQKKVKELEEKNDK